MGVKDVNLREKHLSEELPDQSLEFPSTKDVLSAANCIDDFRNSEDHKVCVALREAGINLHSSCHYKESLGHLNAEINPTFPCYPSQVSDETETISVENVERSFKPECEVGNQRVVKDVLVCKCNKKRTIKEFPAQAVLKNQKAQQEERNQGTLSPCHLVLSTRRALAFVLTHILHCFLFADKSLRNQGNKVKNITLSSYVLKMITGLHICCTFCRVVGTSDNPSRLGVVFPHAIELRGQVPLFSQSKWLHGTTTIQRNGPKDGNMSNQSLWISDQQIKNYNLEIKLPDDSHRLQQFPVKVMYSCDLALDKEDLNSFTEGKKDVEVELIGESNVTKRYLLKMQNQTLLIYYEQKTERQLQLDHVQCNAAFKDIDPEKHESSENSTEKGVKDKSSNIGKYYVAIAFIAAGGAIVMICIIFIYLVKRQRRRTCGGAAELALESIESREEKQIAIYVV